MMRSLGARVDAFQIAFRTRLDARFLSELKARSEVAREHGRASFEWFIDEPNTAMGHSTTRRLGEQAARWVNGYADKDRRRRSILHGELGYSKQRGVWLITNEPHHRLRVLEYAPGGGKLQRCSACRGRGWFPLEKFGLKKTQCLACKGDGEREEPGWTTEIIWYAQKLARIGLAAALEESVAIARLTGEVLESRVRRIDLCADIEGWEIKADDVKRIAKRPRARWAVDDVGPRKEPKVPQCTRSGACKERCTCNDMQVYGSKNTLRDRAISGLAVGRGGALHARIYDKRCELENDRIGDRRREEEARWKAHKWDGEKPVSRVEFQIRGVALSEFGVRDPHACVTPVYRRETYVNDKGKTKIRAVAAGEEVLMLPANDDGDRCAFCKRGGNEERRALRLSSDCCTCTRPATIVDRLEAIWRTCLDWVRLVVPEVSASGRPIPVSRLSDDPRWALLRSVHFQKNGDGPIRRYRPRSCASAAQALGVALSQAGRDGRIEWQPEGKEHYGDDEAAERVLHAKVLMLFTQSAESVTRWLVDRFGGVAGASVHYAVRANASRARFMVGIDELTEAFDAKQRDGPLTAAS